MSQRKFEDPYRPLLPDNDDIYFTHADPHLGKIIVSKPPGALPSITGIVDWGEAGWYPSYWEYCKMALVVFTSGYIDKIMTKRCDCELATVAEYLSVVAWISMA